MAGALVSDPLRAYLIRVYWEEAATGAFLVGTQDHREGTTPRTAVSALLVAELADVRETSTFAPHPLTPRGGKLGLCLLVTGWRGPGLWHVSHSTTPTRRSARNSRWIDT
jgi:hypothetical protein